MENNKIIQSSIVLIGIGDRGLKKGLNYLSKSEDFHLIAACDPNEKALEIARTFHPALQTYTDLEKLLQERKEKSSNWFTCAYVAIPHAAYEYVISRLICEGIHVLKEKPAGLSTINLQGWQDLANENNVRLLTASQSRFSERIWLITQWLPFIGTIQSIEGIREINVTDLDTGWRASRELANGGAVNDIGWHVMDNVVCCVGDRGAGLVLCCKLLKTKKNLRYDCEDCAYAILEFDDNDNGNKIVCNLHISRTKLRKTNSITLVGASGIIVAQEKTVELSVDGNKELGQYVTVDTDGEEFNIMLEYFRQEINLDKPSERYKCYQRQDLQVTSLIERIYSSDVDNLTRNCPVGNRFSSTLTLNPLKDQLGHHLIWPRITSNVREDVMSQLSRDISIYDNGGIFHEFETEFKAIHDCGSWYALLHNSGSNALSSLYYACSFKPGDEVRN